MSTSIFSTVHNRPEPLKYTVLSWLYRTVAKEIILLDWNSEIPVKGIIEQAIRENCTRPKSELADWKERLQIIRVTNPVPWCLGYGSNIAASHCTGDILFKIDVDCVLVRKEPLCPPPQSFYNGNMGCQHENDRSICGNFMVWTRDYWNVGGIDERFKSYGQEDQDLFNRLQANGSKRHDMPDGTLYHLPHGNNKRMAYCPDQGTIWESTKKNREESANWEPWNAQSTRIKSKITLDQNWYKEIEIAE